MCCGEGFSITFINFPSQNGAASENEQPERDSAKQVGGESGMGRALQFFRGNRKKNPPSKEILLTSFRPNCIAVYLKAGLNASPNSPGRPGHPCPPCYPCPYVLMFLPTSSPPSCRQKRFPFIYDATFQLAVVGPQQFIGAIKNCFIH